MKEREPTASQLREARERFRELLAREGSQEAEFQDLFSSCPFILSNALPLQLSPADIIPQGRLGECGADFLIYPQPIPLIYGAIELKRPDTVIVTVPRQDTIVLSRDSATALAQARETARRLQRRIDGSLPLCAIGGSEYLFLIVGVASDLQRKADTENMRRQLTELLPANCKLIPFDTLLNLFERTIPPIVYFLRPAIGQRPTRSPEWLAAAECCIVYVRKTRGPDSPDITHVQDALRKSGHNHDHAFVLNLLYELIDDGVLGTTDSLFPPWEALYFVRERNSK